MAGANSTIVSTLFSSSTGIAERPQVTNATVGHAWGLTMTIDINGSSSGSLTGTAVEPSSISAATLGINSPVDITSTTTFWNTTTVTTNSAMTSIVPVVLSMPSISTAQVIGIASAVVFGALLLLAAGAVSILWCRRTKPPSHKFVPLEDANDEPPNDSPIFLHIRRDKSVWIHDHDETRPLSWNASAERHTPTSPPPSPGGSSYIGTIATAGSPVDGDDATQSNQGFQGLVVNERVKADSRPQSRASRVFSRMGLIGLSQLRSPTPSDRQEVDSGMRFRFGPQRVGPASPLLDTPPSYTEH
ncbi:hypothetical protein DAEQUDRAFT_770628 [Daedalea quercina L-15889]|uniref:Uncharacterized protein n=1 Tax=Daedalea quercina L-15889 TaxID=1314783 RepID=A0A165KPW7_9APHY|nr:hypothetical protein DAEQUDRAFT_770628 [Daedalea quercina L-15889]